MITWRSIRLSMARCFRRTKLRQIESGRRVTLFPRRLEKPGTRFFILFQNQRRRSSPFRLSQQIRLRMRYLLRPKRKNQLSSRLLGFLYPSLLQKFLCLFPQLNKCRQMFFWRRRKKAKLAYPRQSLPSQQYLSVVYFSFASRDQAIDFYRIIYMLFH